MTTIFAFPGVPRGPLQGPGMPDEFDTLRGATP